MSKNVPPLYSPGQRVHLATGVTATVKWFVHSPFRGRCYWVELEGGRLDTVAEHQVKGAA